MDSNKIYSTSLKRMIGFKLFPNINPQAINAPEVSNQKNSKIAALNLQKNSDKQMFQIKKELAVAREKNNPFSREVDNIMNTLVGEGLAQVNNRKVKKHGSSKHLRILTQPDQVVKKRQQSHLPLIPNSISTHKLKSFRLKTQAKLNEENEIYQPVDTQKFLKHYRAGMSSLSKLKTKPFN